MRVVVAPDSFTGSMTAPEAASAIIAGWHSVAPHDELVPLPVSDGGPGFLAALRSAIPDAEQVPVATTDAHGRPIEAPLLLQRSVPATEGHPEQRTTVTAYIESACVVGRDGDVLPAQPLTASSRGLAPLLLAAVDAGATRIVVGLGGSITTDGGAGLLAGLGATALDDIGRPADHLMSSGGGSLGSIGSVDLTTAELVLSGVEIVVAADVDNPLTGPRGAARGFSPQKGAEPAAVTTLEAALEHFADVVGRRADGRNCAVALGSGAAGGLGFALLRLGGTYTSGADLVLQRLRLADEVSRADLVVTGEGSFDWQSLRGKLVTGVCRVAMDQGRPIVVLAGQLGVGRREWMSIGVSAAYAILDPDLPPPDEEELQHVLAKGPSLLSEIAARAARTWSH